MAKAHEPITPGEILRTEFLEPLGISPSRLAEATGLPRRTISEIAQGKRKITVGTALRPSRVLSVDDRFWIDVQNDYDLETVSALGAEDLATVTVLVSE